MSTSRSRWPPTNAPSRPKCVGRQGISLTPTQLDFPPRYRVGDDGSLSTRYELVPLPRTGTVYTETTVHIPVPGLRTPYSLVIVELDGVEVRALVKVTGAQPGTVGIGDRGRLALRRVAVRSGCAGLRLCVRARGVRGPEGEEDRAQRGGCQEAWRSSVRA